MDPSIARRNEPEGRKKKRQVPIARQFFLACYPSVAEPGTAVSQAGRASRFLVLVLSCLVSFECTLWEGFFWRMPKQAYTVPCRASHPRGQGAQVLCT